MKRIVKYRAETTIRVFIAITLCLLPFFLLSQAQAGPQSTAQTVSSANSVEPDNEIIFDGEGNVDYVINPPGPSTTGENDNIESFRSVIIDGDQYVLSTEIVMYHYLSQPVTVDDIRPEDYVGFKIDPSDKIVELWILNPDQKKSQDQNLQNADLTPDPPSIHPGKIRKEGDIWTN